VPPLSSILRASETPYVPAGLVFITKVVPSNVRFASAFAFVPSPVSTLLFALFEIDTPPPPETAANVKLPEPSVCSTWFALPSEVGNVYALLNLTPPLSMN